MPYVREPCALTAWTGQPGRCNWCDAEIPPGGRRTVWCRDACRRAWERNHLWRRARIYARRRAGYRCSRPGCTAERGDVEINHRTPREGAGYGPGCHHHQDPAPDPATGVLVGGLEALCHRHHVEETNRQRAERRTQAEAATPTPLT